MAVDFNRIIQAAAEAALQGEGPTPQSSSKDAGKGKRKGLTAPRALLLGAGAFTAGRLLLGSRGRDVLDNLQERLATFEGEHLTGSQRDDDEEDFDEDEEFEEEPEGEYDEEFEQEPEGEYDEDEEPEEERPRRHRRTSSAGTHDGRR